MTMFLRNLVGRLRRRPAPFAVRASDAGFALLDGDRPRGGCAWDEVEEVVAFKRDLGTHDEICLACRDAGGWVEVGEAAEGWGELLDAVGRRFPTIPPDWYGAVMLPPFATCYRVLYERPRPAAAATSAAAGPPGGAGPGVGR